MDFAQQLVNGVQIGSVYALVAIGYTMVYGIAKMINFAHGDIIMVGSYVALLFFQSSGLPVWGVIAATAAVSAVLGVTIERLAYKPLRGGSRMSALITTIGVSLMLQNGFLLIFGSSPKPFPNHFTGEGFTLGGVTVSRLTAITLVVTVVLMVLLTLFVNRTRVGKAMRAVSEDQGAAQLMGINIDTSISITFAIGSALAAVAAVLYSSTYPLINPYMGSMLGLRAFIAAVIGGIGVIPGAMIGGFIIGIAEALIATAVGLFVAIPAVCGYNIFRARLTNIEGVCINYAGQLLNRMQHEVNAYQDGISFAGER